MPDLFPGKLSINFWEEGGGGGGGEGGRGVEDWRS